MSYATIADVQRLNPVRKFTQNSTPSLDDVAGYLADTAAELNGVFAALDYSVPIPASATQSYRLVERWNALGAHALAECASPDSPLAKDADAQWKDVLARLAKGQVKLPDYGKDPAQVQMRTRTPATAMFYRDSSY